MRLVACESPAEKARRCFAQRDPDGSGFIQHGALEPVLRALGMAPRPEGIRRLISDMDKEGMGIILIDNFVSVLYPEAAAPATSATPPAEFDVVHYNGIARPGGEVSC